MLGLDGFSPVGHPLGECCPGLTELVEQVVAHQQEVASQTIAVRSGHHVFAQATAQTEPAGTLTSVLIELYGSGAASSISANLEHLDRLAGLGIVTAGVAHEIKNALVAVRTYFDLAALGENDSDLRGVAASEIQRIEKTVRQLLRGAKREQFRLAPLGVHALASDSIHLVRHELQARNIQLTTDLSATLDRVSGDERQLRHAFLNILLNAIEAIGSDGQITVTSQVVEAWERPHVRISVKDTGPGIPATALPSLFDPFFTTKAEGTGLGLPISQRIVQAHNGAITVESTPGEGATFHIFLPVL